MAERAGFYWDLEECGWVRCPSRPLESVEIPEQQTVADRTGIAAEQEADVRSG